MGSPTTIVMTCMNQLFDRIQFRLRAARLKREFSKADFLHKEVVARMLDDLEDSARTFPLAALPRIPSVEILEEILNNRKIGDISNPENEDKWAAIETETWPHSPEKLDLIFAPLSFHTLNDLPGMLIQMRRSLKPDGLLMGSLFGGNTLAELRTSLTQAESDLKGGISPRVHPTITLQDMGSLLQRAGFALPVLNQETITVSYRNIYALMHDLRHMGEANMMAARPKTFTSKALFEAAQTCYARHFSDNEGALTATFDVIFFQGWAPDASQPQALQPGEAKVDLKDVLS